MGLLHVPNIVVNGGAGGSKKGDAQKADGTKENVREGERQTDRRRDRQTERQTEKHRDTD